MKYYVVIPAHNEEAYLPRMLDTLLGQTLPAHKIVVVNDHSSDGTEVIIDQYAARYPVLTKVNVTSSGKHLPGSKVINAFHAGYKVLDDEYDFIAKLDADLLLPETYFERISKIFSSSPKVGIAGGFSYEKDREGHWRLHHPMDKTHIRGAFKSYTRKCFKSIGGLRNAMGWDTLDELLAQYHGFELFTDDSLAVKTLRPVGSAYDKEALYLQGIAMYRMHYGFWISAIASAKMAWKKRDPAVFIDNLLGYFKARKGQMPYLVTPEEGRFIRRLRWGNIRKKLF